MRGRPVGNEHDRTGFARACAMIESASRPFGISRHRILAKAKRDPDGREAARLEALAADLELGRVRCEPQSVAAAASGLALMAALAGMAASALAVLSLDPAAQASVAVSAALGPLICYRAVLSYPASVARRRASELLKACPDAVNLMVMAIRQDASLTGAIEFAGSGDSAFARELKRCTWEVVTGTHTSFEEAVHDIGVRWERFSPELKTSLNALVVASREGTDEGKRRSLERANRAMVAGAKRRVEEYALSLSTPSMLLFGLGILLPIMVGSFMPMLSWDIWSGVALEGGGPARDDLSFETAALMDVVFPAVAFAVAADAVSRRPVDQRPQWRGRSGPWRSLAAAVVGGGVCSACAHAVLGAGAWAPAILLAGMLPASCALVLAGGRARTGRRACEDDAQDLLFRTGARMLDGDNFESALHRSARGSEGPAHALGRRLCMRAFVMGRGLDAAVSGEAPGQRANALEALKVVGRASTKDEAGAGMMAMDIATYLRELSEIESTLKMRIRPTISMMRMTAHVLGPVVLGVTYAIYLSLGSVAGGYGDPGAAGEMLLVLGVFLALMNAAVCYFVWGIEGGGDRHVLARSVGACVAVSQLVFVGTALLST